MNYQESSNSPTGVPGIYDASQLVSRVPLNPEAHWDWHIPTTFSQGWRIGSLIFTGGQLSADERGNVVGLGDIQMQTRNVFEHLTRVLAEGGASWADVVKLNTYYVFNGSASDAQEYWETMTSVRKEYLADPGPAATAVRVAGLMYDGFLVEADAVAVIRADSESPA